jgi:hypothetical protein
MCAKSNLNQLKSVRMTMIEMNLKKFISEKAKLFDKSKIEVLEIFKDKDQFAIPVNKGDEYFYYVGPFDDKNRPFCHYILSLDKVFRREDIDWMTFNLGYNVFKYEGSYGCRHNWVRFRGKEIDGTLPTEKQIDNLIQDQIDSGLEQ